MVRAVEHPGGQAYWGPARSRYDPVQVPVVYQVAEESFGILAYQPTLSKREPPNAADGQIPWAVIVGNDVVETADGILNGVAIPVGLVDVVVPAHRLRPGEGRDKTQAPYSRRG